MGDQNQWEKEVVIMQDSPSFLSRAKSPMRKKLFSFGIQVLYSKRMTFIVHAHTHTHTPPGSAQGLGFFIV